MVDYTVEPQDVERYLTINERPHGTVWWVCVGWWFRPMKNLVARVRAKLGGYAGVRIRRYYRTK